jgi:hypothetical protein
MSIPGGRREGISGTNLNFQCAICPPPDIGCENHPERWRAFIQDQARLNRAGSKGYLMIWEDEGSDKLIEAVRVAAYNEPGA